MNEISPEHTALLVQVAAAIGKKFAKQYPAVEAEDISSEVTTTALTHWSHYAKALKRAAEYDKAEYEVLHYQLSLKAREYCGKQHYRYMVDHPQALVYTPKEVRALLQECYFDPEAYETPVRDEHLGVAVEAKSVWANLMDVRDALHRVSDKTHDILLAAFGPKGPDDPTPDSRRVSDAVNAVTRELNKHLNQPRHKHEGPGSRKAVPNGYANYLTSAVSASSTYNALENYS
ncbi:hypothetical protein ACTMTF_15395 [Nonomuraea sp. ZG12]|uniref:hypothetical protein n=1 Tax=Nonomuraea sp. ZG12 TaxID=3452207 RepID=UPI003F8C6119